MVLGLVGLSSKSFGSIRFVQICSDGFEALTCKDEWRQLTGTKWDPDGIHGGCKIGGGYDHFDNDRQRD